MLARFVEVYEAKALNFLTIEVDPGLASSEELFSAFLERLKVDGNAEAEFFIRSWLQNIGRYGIRHLELRQERAVFAIPPKGAKGRKQARGGTAFLFTAFSGLPSPRLYLTVFENTVVLFGGGIKTTRNADECPNVGPAFRLANRICSRIDKLIEEREIRVIPDVGLQYPPNFIFEIP